MVKIIFFICILFFSLLLPNPLWASEENLSVILFYNQSRFNTTSTSKSTYGSSAFGGESENFSGTGYGILYEKPLKNQWALETGFAYFSRGSISNGYTSLDRSTTKWNSLYIPIVGRFRPNKTFTGFIGGYGSYAIGKVTTTSQSSYSTTPTTTLSDFKNLGLKPFEGGLTYGAGINWQINSATTMILEIRLNEGLSNINDPDANTQNNNNNSSVNIENKAYMRETWFVLGFLI